MSDVAHETAADVVADIIGDDAPVAAADEVVEQSAPDEAPAFEFPSFEADTSGIEDLFDDEPEPEPEAVYTETEDTADDEYYDDTDEAAKLRRELAKTQKRLAWAEEQRVKTARKDWKAEASRRFPLADVDEIQADSRRSFLKQAAAQHQRYAKKVQPVMDALEALKSQAVAEVKQEARQQAEEAWGRPTSGPQAPVVEQATDDARLDRGNFRTLHDRTLALIRAGKLEI